jgi:hypothetical protein
MRIPSFAAVAIATLIPGSPKPAAACGGCFHEISSSADTVVTGHRMAFALSEHRTVLWDQIQFSGSPSEFGWVLPVKPGAYIEASTDAWFESLETVTKVQVASPQVTCPPPAGSGTGDGCSCGFDKVADAASGSTNFSGGGGFLSPPPVTVVHQGTVGAFETVTLRSTDGSKLRQWLGDHGYAVPTEIEPVIDTYVSEGADFIALRLIPGKGVNEMTPVRVVTPSGDPILPLRMVAAGTGMFVDIVLYVIGEGRFGLKDLTESTVKLGTLTFDFNKNDSNYAKLRTDALNENNGFSYITAFARPDMFWASFADGNGAPVTFSDTGSNQYNSFTSLYFGQASVNDGRPASASGPFDSCPQAVLNRLSSNQVVTLDPGDAALRRVSDDGGRPRVDAGKIITGPMSSDYTCNGHDDIAAALIGMHPDRVWVARLEMNLPREALNMDCNVGLASTQEGVTNQLKARKATNLPCAGAVLTGGVADSFANSTATCVSAIASLFAMVIARRRERRRRL